MSKKSIVLISASPKVSESSVSEFLSLMQADIMQSEEAHIVNVRNSYTNKTVLVDYEAMLKADALVITFPLYIYCLPGMLQRFLQDYYDYWLENKDTANPNKKVYAVVNCGFPEPGINEEAARVIQSFSEKTGSKYRFSLLIGGGGMILGTENVPFMKKTFKQIKDAFKLMASDIMSDCEALKNIYVSMNFPKRMYLYAGDKGWYSLAKKNGLSKSDLYRKPYLNS